MKNLKLTSRALPERLPKWGITVLESHHAPDFVMEWRRHPFVKLVYALHGAGVLHVDKQPCEFQSKDVLVVPAGQRNRIVDSSDEPASLYVLCIAPAVLAFDSAIEGRLLAGRLPRSDYLANRVESLLRRLLFQQSHGGRNASLAMAASALSLLQLVVEKPSPESQRGQPQRSGVEEIHRYVDHLNAHFFEAEDIASAARKLGMSRRTFTKRFREVTGKSWLEYVRGIAIDHAARLLVETPAPIASIAFECGFTDLSTFYRHFKAITGTTPSVWRKTKPVSPGALRR